MLNILLYFLTPILLLSLIVVFGLYEKKIKRGSDLDKKDYYWSKNSNIIDLKKTTSNLIDIALLNYTLVYVCSVIFFMIIHKFGNTKYILSFDFTAYLGIVISICLSSIAIISLLVSLKKEYYLTITIIDIIIDYKIIRMVMSILLDAFFFVILYFCNQFFLKNNISEYSLVIKLFMLSLFIVIVIITLFMLYQTIKICVYNNKRELKNNKVLRFKVADNYIAADSEKYSIVGIRQNINYLIEEIISQYKKAKFSECCFKDVDFYSSILCKVNKKYAKESDKDQKELNKKIKYCGSFCVFIVAAIMELVTFYSIFLDKVNPEKTYIFIQIILTLIIF